MAYEEVRELIGPKRTLEILDLLQRRGPLNYSNIEDEVPSSSDTISQRLTTLSEYDLIDRREKSVKNVQYAVTERGEEVLRQVQRLQTVILPAH